jgi:hypothetical protein
MSVTDALIAAGDDVLETAGPVHGSFVDRLVQRLHLEYGDDPGAIRALVDDVLATFAGARVQAFVPILVEKQVRQFYRRRNGCVPALSG